MDRFNNIHRFRRLEPRFTSVSAVGSPSAEKPTEAPASSRVQKGTALSSMSFFIIGFSSRLRVSLEKLSNASECSGGLAALSSLTPRHREVLLFRNVCRSVIARRALRFVISMNPAGSAFFRAPLRAYAPRYAIAPQKPTRMD